MQATQDAVKREPSWHQWELGGHMLSCPRGRTFSVLFSSRFCSCCFLLHLGRLTDPRVTAAEPSISEPHFRGRGDLGNRSDNSSAAGGTRVRSSLGQHRAWSTLQCVLGPSVQAEPVADTPAAADFRRLLSFLSPAQWERTSPSGSRENSEGRPGLLPLQ